MNTDSKKQAIKLLQELTEEQAMELYEKVSSMRNYIPKVGILGKAGVGKSTLCKEVFGQDDVKISDVEAGTTSPTAMFVPLAGEKGIILIDFPGVGENIKKGKEYQSKYRELIPELDVIIWVVKADDRAYETEESVYKEVVRPSLRNVSFVMAISQAEKIEPSREWNFPMATPGPNQKENINRKVELVSSLFGIPARKAIPISAKEGYNLSSFVDAIVEALPDAKKPAFVRVVKDKWVSKVAKKMADKAFQEQVKRGLVKAGALIGPVLAILMSEHLPDIIDAIGERKKTKGETA